MVYFIRHGRKVKADSKQYYNEQLRIVDDPLSEEGAKDAERIAVFFKDIDIKKIYVSQYKRAYQTAMPTAKDKNLPITIDERVNEINNGELGNMSDEEVAAAFPQLWKDFCSHECDVRFPGGDSGEDVKRRQDNFLDEIKDDKEDIMVVTHEGYIRLLMCNILGLPVYKRYKFKVDMGGVSAVYYDEDDGWKIVKFNQSV